MADGDLRRVWDKAVRAAELRNRIPGRLGKPGGAVVVSARPGYLYVRLSSEGGQTVVIARNDGVPRLYDLPVWLELEHNIYVVSGVDGTRLEAFIGTADGGGGGVGYHTHATGTGLEYEVEAIRLEPGRVKHFTGLQVQINPFRYWTGSAWETYTGGILDLTSNQPATAGTHAWVLVGVNPATNTAVATTGTAYGYATPLTLDMLDDISFNAYIPLTAVRVRADDTALSSISKYVAAQAWLDYPGAAASSSGDVTGPVSSTDNAITRWDGTGGDTLQDSGVTIDDSNNLDMGGAQIRDYAEQPATTSQGTTTYDIDWSAASFFEITLTGNPTFTFSNLAAGRSLTLVLIQDGTGSRTVTWPGSVHWPNGTPTLDTTAAAIDVITLFVRNDGSTVEGFSATEASAGDVSGPVSSTDNAIVRWDGTGGDTLQDSGVTIDDNDNLDLGGAEIRDYAEQTTTTSQGTTTYDIDWAAASVYEITLTGNPTFTFSNLVSGRSVTLVLIQDGTGGRSVTWPGAVHWPNGAPTLDTTASAIDAIVLFVRNDGTTVEGFSATDAGGEQVKVSANDTTAGYLNGKLVAGSNISLTEGSDGGDETLTIAITGILPSANGGTGIDNGGRTLTIATNSGTLAFGAAASTLTIPATGTAALLATANVFTAAQTISSDTNPPFEVIGGSAGARYEVQRTSGGVALRMLQARLTNTTGSLSTDIGSIGFYGDLQTAPTAPTLNYMFISLYPNDAHNTAIFKATPTGIGIGLSSVSTPSATIHADQSSTTGAIPVLRLRQQDLSEEFIRFQATVGAGNAIDTAALGAYYGKVRVYVEGVGAKWLALYN